MQGEKYDVELLELDVALVFVVHEVGGNDEDGAQGCSGSIAAHFSASCSTTSTTSTYSGVNRFSLCFWAVCVRPDQRRKLASSRSSMSALV